MEAEIRTELGLWPSLPGGCWGEALPGGADCYGLHHPSLVRPVLPVDIKEAQ